MQVNVIDNQEQLRYSDLVVQEANDKMKLQLIDLPDVCLEAILSNLSYDEISKYRIVRSLLLRIREEIYLLCVHVCIVERTASHGLILFFRSADSSTAPAKSC